MRLMLFSDVHLDAPFEWAPPPVARKRRQALRDTFLRILQLAGDLQVEALLCGGDLYEHDRFSPDTAAFLQTAFERLHPLPVYIAPGNHDWYGPESLYRCVEWSPNIHVFKSDHLEPATLAGGLTLWGGAHCAPANTGGFLDGFTLDRGGVHLALFHGSERGWLAEQGTGKLAHAPFDAEQIERVGLNHVFLGHYHRPRDAARHTYPGNPEPLTFGEDGDRGVVIASISPDGAVSRERRAVSTNDVYDGEINVTPCRSQQDIRERVAATLTGRCGVARLTFAGELHPDVTFDPDGLHDAAAWMDALVVRVGALRTGYDLGTIANEPTVRGQFVQDVMAANLTDDLRRRVLITGLRALDGRADLEMP